MKQILIKVKKESEIKIYIDILTKNRKFNSEENFDISYRTQNVKVNSIYFNPSLINSRQSGSIYFNCMYYNTYEKVTVFDYQNL